MRRIVKQILSVTLCTAMVLTGMNVSSVKVSAAEVDTDMIANTTAKYNLAKDGAVSYLHMYSDGEGTTPDKVTDGSLDTAQFVINDASDNWGPEGGETYVMVDLGDYYDASTIDEVIVAYKTTDTGICTVLNRAYSVMYSADGVNFQTVVDNRKVTAFDDETRCATIDDVSGATGTVRYVKIYYPKTANYGMQLKEVAVLDTDLNAETVEVENCDDAAGVTVSSSEYGVIDFNITAGEGQDDYKYVVYLDDSVAASVTDCVAGKDYSITGVESGTHTIKVVSVYNGKVSLGLVSDSVTVKTIVDEVTNAEKNLAYGKEFELSSGTSTEGLGSITNGIISGSDYVSSGRGDQGAETSYFTIDLGADYDTSYIDSVYVWYRISVGGCYPENGGYQIQYSTDNTEFTTVATVTQEEFNALDKTAPFVSIVDVSGASASGVRAVRYVRIYYPQAVAYGAQLTEVAVFGTAVEAEPAVEVDVPGGLTATSDKYNTITAVVAAATGHTDYTYEVTVGKETKAATVGEKVVFEGIAAGTYTVSAKSVDAEGNKSKAVTAQVVVEDGFEYTRTNDSNDLFPATNENGNNYIGSKATATASSGDAGLAIDANVGTRWESKQGVDPQYITVNLGEILSIKEVSMNWEGANAKNYTVEVSANGVEWETVATISNQAEGARKDVIVLKETVDAQYVKINGTARNLTYGYSIWELAVYGPNETPVAEVKAPEVVGLQMNTDVAGVSKQGPSFRVMNTIPENATVGTYGTVYALASEVDNIEIESGDANVYTHIATELGTVSYNGTSYYALTFTNNGTNAAAMEAEYVVRPYVIDNGTYKYGEAYVVSVYNIAKQLYDNQMMSNETAHNYLYNNVLNVVTINNNKIAAVKALFTALDVTSSADDLYNGCGKVVFDTLTDYVANGYEVGVGRTKEPVFEIDEAYKTIVEEKLGMTVEEWMVANNWYYAKVAAPSNVIE